MMGRMMGAGAPAETRRRARLPIVWEFRPLGARHGRRRVRTLGLPRPTPVLDLIAFDLDGTLADTETLKAESYGWAAHRLRPDVGPADVEGAYTDCIGLSRQEIATSLLRRFELEDAARAHDGSVEPWQSYVGVRLERYRGMLADGSLVRARAREHAVSLVRDHGGLARRVALVTTSGAHNTGMVLGALGLADAFDTVVTADDVTDTKPDPEGYLLALSRTGADARRSLAVEDSPAGVRGAVAAGFPVVAVPDAHTRDGVQALVRAGLIGAGDVVTPETLRAAVSRRAGALG